jgi:hypothetical protein
MPSVFRSLSDARQVRRIFALSLSFCLLTSKRAMSVTLQLAIVTEPSLDPAASHGIAKLREALAAGGFCKQNSSNLQADVVVANGPRR